MVGGDWWLCNEARIHFLDPKHLLEPFTWVIPNELVDPMENVLLDENIGLNAKPLPARFFERTRQTQPVRTMQEDEGVGTQVGRGFGLSDSGGALCPI